MTQVNACAVPLPNCQAGDDQSVSNNNACNRVLCDAECVSFCTPKGDAQCFEYNDIWEIGNFPEVGIHTAKVSHGVEIVKPPPELTFTTAVC